MAEELLGAWADRVGNRLLVQPDARSCGASVLVVARLLEAASYAPFVADPDSFRAEVLAMHRRVTSVVDIGGRLQLPWPRALGTPPWAVAHQLEGTTGLAHHVRPLLGDRDAAYDEIGRATAAGHPVPLYVGSRWLPRHVVLVLGQVGGRLRCYEPSSGGLADVDRAAFTGGRLALAGWDRPWFMVLP